MMKKINVVLESIIASGNAVMNNKIGHAPIFKDKEHLYQIMNNLFMVWDDKKRDKWLSKVMSLWSQIEEQLASKSLFVNHPNLADTIAKQCQCAARLIIKNQLPYLVIGVEKRNDNAVFIDCVNIPILNEEQIDFNKLLKKRKHKYDVLPKQFSTFFAGSPLLNSLFNPIYKTKSAANQDPNCLSDLREALLEYQKAHNDTELFKLLVMCQGHHNYINKVGVVFNKKTFKKCMKNYTENSDLDKLIKHAQISNLVIGELQTNDANDNDEIIGLPISFQLHIPNNWMIDNLFPNNLVADAWKQTQQETDHKMFEVNHNVQVNITPAIKQRAFWIDGLSFFTTSNGVKYIKISQELSLFGGNYFSNQWKEDTMNCLKTWLSNPAYHNDLTLEKMLEMFIYNMPSDRYEKFENLQQALYISLEDSEQIMMLYSVFDFYRIDLKLQHVNLKLDENNRLICTLKNVELRDDPKMKTMTTLIKTLLELMPQT